VTSLFTLRLFFHPENEGSTFLRKTGKDQRDYLRSIVPLITADDMQYKFSRKWFGFANTERKSRGEKYRSRVNDSATQV
jgi:hypothetical protein